MQRCLWIAKLCWELFSHSTKMSDLQVFSGESTLVSASLAASLILDLIVNLRRESGIDDQGRRTERERERSNDDDLAKILLFSLSPCCNSSPCRHLIMIREVNIHLYTCVWHFLFVLGKREEMEAWKSMSGNGSRSEKMFTLTGFAVCVLFRCHWRRDTSGGYERLEVVTYLCNYFVCVRV